MNLPITLAMILAAKLSAQATKLTLKTHCGKRPIGVSGRDTCPQISVRCWTFTV